MNHIARPSAAKLPRTYYTGNLSGELQETVDRAAAEWNAIYPCFKKVLTPEADVTFVTDVRTWVEMPSSTNPRSVVHVGLDVDLRYWMAHELGHTLGFADHLPDGYPTDGYINPGTSVENYEGVMSYGVGRQQWFGLHDKQMLAKAYPLKRRIRIPLLSRG